MIKIDLTAKYILAVSGGIDSMTMLHMFSSLSPRPNFSVVTVNHNIRKEAQSDCDFVENYCKSLGVECRKIFVDVPRYAEENKVSEETAARILRYQALNDADCDYICLAHHTGDNAETVLMHILRGSGAQGAAGIRAQNGKYIRPLLDMTRQQIEAYATEHNVPYVNDFTNGEIKYTRNFIRNNVFPLLKEIYPNAEKKISRFAENIAEDNDFIDGMVDLSSVEFDSDCARIPTALLKQPQPIAKRAVNKVFNRLGVYKDIERSHVEAIIDLANGDGGRRVNLPFGFTAVCDYDYVSIEKSVRERTTAFEIPFSIGQTVTPTGIVEVSKTPAEHALRFDFGKLPDGCVLRLRRLGDTFVKFGGGTKTLKKYLIDKKVPQRQRDELILIAKESEVYVICGLEISDKIRVDDNSDVYYVSVNKGEIDEIQ